MCLSQILLFQWRLGFGGWESNREGDGQMDKVLATQTLGPKFRSQSWPSVPTIPAQRRQKQENARAPWPASLQVSKLCAQWETLHQKLRWQVTEECI